MSGAIARTVCSWAIWSSVTMRMLRFECRPKQVGESLAWCSGSQGRDGGRSRFGIRGSKAGGGEEALGLPDQRVDAAGQPVGGDGILEQAPDPRDRVVLVGAVLGQPEQPEAGGRGLGQP